MENVVVLCSGGLDSTVLLYRLLAEGRDVWPLGVRYGQRHARELAAARYVCERRLALSYEEVDLSSLRPLLGASCLTSDQPVPHGHYEDPAMRATVVPNRNMLLLAVAGAYAITVGVRSVAYAAHGGDRAVYPDCRAEFVQKMDGALGLCHNFPIHLHTPFLHWKKVDIVKEGVRLGVPFGMTWSCYEGREHPCGRCGACVERCEAFELAGAVDA